MPNNQTDTAKETPSINKFNDYDALLRDIIRRIAVGPDRGKDITADEAFHATKGLLNAELDPVHAALFLIGLRMKRESLAEYSGIYQALASTVQPVAIDLPELLYLADPFDGYARHFPMSPFIPPVLAACGLSCLQQGVESVGPKFGITSHQVYRAYGLIVNDDAITAQQSLTSPECGWAYLDQQSTQPQLHALRDFRDQIVKRTALTTLERLLKPITAHKTYLALGYVHKAYPEIYGHIAQQAGFDNTLLLKGIEGGVTPALNKPIRSFTVSPDALSQKIVETELTAAKATNGLQTPSGVFIQTTTDEKTSTNLAEQTLQHGLSALRGEDGIAFQCLSLACTLILNKLRPQHSWDTHKLTVEESIRDGSALARFDAYKPK